MTAVPHDLTAEQAALGSALLSREAAEGITHRLEASDFYRPAHGKVFAAIRSLVERGMEVDAVAIRSECRELPADFLLELGSVTSSVTWRTHAETVRRMAKYRSLQTLCMEVGHKAEEAAPDLDGVLDEVESRLALLTSDRSEGRASKLDGIMASLDLSTKVESFTSEILPGCYMQRGELVLIGARPSVGKSALAAQLADELASRHVKVRIWSYEMNRDQYARRLVQHRTGFGFHQQVVGLAAHEIEYAKHVMDGDWQRFITVDDSNPSLSSLVRQVHRAAKGGTDIIIIDHLHILVDGSNRQAITDATRRLKLAANDARLSGDSDRRPVIICLAQFSRLETRDDGTFKPPTMQSFKESGSVEADADIAVLLHTYSDTRDQKPREELCKQGYLLEYDAQKGDGSRRLAHIHVAKNRYGKLGMHPAWFSGDDQTWSLINQLIEGRAP